MKSESYEAVFLASPDGTLVVDAAGRTAPRTIGATELAPETLAAS